MKELKDLLIDGHHAKRLNKKEVDDRLTDILVKIRQQE